MQAAREAFGFLEVSTSTGVSSLFIAPKVTVHEAAAIPPLVKRQNSSHMQPQPSILPLRVTRTSRQPIGLQEGIEAFEKYTRGRDIYLGVRRPEAKPSPTYQRPSRRTA